MELWIGGVGGVGVRCVIGMDLDCGIDCGMGIVRLVWFWLWNKFGCGIGFDT